MRVAVLDDYQGRAHAMADWDSLNAQVDFFPAPRPPASFTGYDVLVLMRERTRFDADALSQLPDLKLVVTTGMRNASLDTDYLRQAGVPVCGTGTPNSGPGLATTVEIAWALIFAVVKRVVPEDQNLRAGGWQTDRFPSSLAGRTLGLAGLGRLGAQMVAPARAFGMDVAAWSQNLTDERAQQAGVRRVSFDELLSSSDVLSIHLVLSERTRGLFGADALARLKDGAAIINTSRGPIIDTPALLGQLGRISAGLDVYDTEPLTADDPIVSAPNTVLTPHLGYVTESGLEGMYRQAVEDIAAFVSGEPIRLIG